jgi:hypothetical protein
MAGLGILVCEHGRDIECYPCLPDMTFSAEGDAFGDVASQ